MNLYHWADNVAEKVIREKGNKAKYTLASGITPSGTIHIGNFREIITVDIVAKAFLRRGKKIRFIYSWDDYDVFRKVPSNMPNQSMLKKHLRKTIVDVPDPFDKKDSYARNNETIVEKDIVKVGIEPEFIYQAKMYRAGKYVEEIKKALEKTDKIKKELNEHRKKPLDKNWLPISIFCEKCSKDTIKKLEWKGDYTIYYKCECNFEDEFNFKKKPLLKLKWRVDWPMRWYYEKVDFEPGGKDHSTSGGSFDTGKQICKEVWGFEAPSYIMYEWIGIKGKGQFASSSGNVITLNELLEIYEPEIVRYLFAGTRPNAEFAISFDLDVIKIYEDFDKCERIYFKEQKSKNHKEFEKQKRIYELSAVNKLSKNMSFQPPFRHLTTIVQVYEGNIQKVVDHYKEIYSLKSKQDVDKLKVRAKCSYNWISKYAPEDIKFKIQDKVKTRLSAKEKIALNKVSDSLRQSKFSESELKEHFYNVCEEIDLEPKQFFKAAYKVLVNKESGPKLASFVLILGDRAINLFSKV